MNTLNLTDEWIVIKKFLPKGWSEKAREFKAIIRQRKIDSPDSILRTLLIHLIEGISLRTTAAYAREAKLCSINDVALLHRLKNANEWFRWMAEQLLKEMHGEVLINNKLLHSYQVRIVDGTVINEPGSTGTDWRIHYSFQLNNLRCDEFLITDPKSGEGFNRYKVSPGELLMGDRCYCKATGIAHVLTSGGQVITRFHSTSLPLFSRNGKSFEILPKIRSLQEGEIGDLDVWFKWPETKKLIKGRLCIIRKSLEAIEKAKKAIRSEAKKKQRKLKTDTLEYAEYIIIFTTLTRKQALAKDILLMYRGRWQIELMFKRLKGILRLGHLPKYNPQSCKAWLHGKMLVALLIERIYQEADFFSPWGFPI